MKMSRDKVDELRISKLQECMFRVQHLEAAIKKHMNDAKNYGWEREPADRELWEVVS